MRKECGMHREFKTRKVFYHTIMCCVSFLMLYPLLWMVFSSFKEENDILLTAKTLIPRKATLVHYIEGWKGVGKYSFGAYFRNSFFQAILRVIGMTVSCTIVAYGFARIRFRLRGFWFALMIGSMCLPEMVLRIPQYLFFNNLGWVGTYLPIIVPSFFGNAYFIFMVMQFMKGIPRELDESAKIDGCGWFGLFARIMLPLVQPAVAMVAIMTFIDAWNDFYGALIYLNKPSLYPVAYALKFFSDMYTTDYGSLLAMSTLSLVPVILLFSIFQKSLIEGIATTGIKG